MNETIVIAISLILALGVGFLIHTLIEMRKAAEEMRAFLKKTGESIDETLEETKATLRSVRSITDTVNGVADDVRKLSHRVSDTAKGIKSVAAALGDASSKTRLSTIALGVGIKAAFDVFSRKIAARKSESEKEVGHGK